MKPPLFSRKGRLLRPVPTLLLMNVSVETYGDESFSKFGSKEMQM